MDLDAISSLVLAIDDDLVAIQPSDPDA